MPTKQTQNVAKSPKASSPAKKQDSQTGSHAHLDDEPINVRRQETPKRARKWARDFRRARRKAKRRKVLPAPENKFQPQAQQQTQRPPPPGPRSPKSTVSRSPRSPKSPRVPRSPRRSPLPRNLPTRQPTSASSNESSTKSNTVPRKKPSVYDTTTNAVAPAPTLAVAKEPAPANPQPQLNSQKQVQDAAPSRGDLQRLLRDGRKTPEQYRAVVQVASSPSQLSLRSISEFYNIPSSKFSTLADVFRYRGYKKLNKVDEGAFGIVSRAIRSTDRTLVAVKEIDLSKKRNKRIEEMKRELFVLQKIESDLIVKLIEHFIVDQTLVIIMEFCAGSNLTSYLKEVPISENEALLLFKQMARAMKVLHRKGIAHRDVKLNNFLLDSTRKKVKVADFGLSVVSYRRAHGIILAKTYCGTEPYMAPEILRRNSQGMRSYNPIYADIWSLGVCLFAMLTRTFPFKMNLSQRGLFRAQTARRWRFPRSLRESISEELKDLVWHMLDPEPERRISINGVVSHPWLNLGEAITLSQDES